MITTHVLDIGRGVPASGVAVVLERRHGESWLELGRGETDAKGRLNALADDAALTAGTYRLRFDVAAYQRGAGIAAPFFPEATVAFEVREAGSHYHVPLVLSPFGYSTYRGT
jgi:5-hydroxyisourate hydrolase